MHAKKAADKHAAKFFNDMGGYAPTIGIIGTVMGLVHVLENLVPARQARPPDRRRVRRHPVGRDDRQRDLAAVGSRLKRLSQLEAGRMELVIEGVLAVQAGANPRVVAQRLHSLLPGARARRRAEGRLTWARDASGERGARGAREPRALAGQLRRHDDAADGAVHRDVRDQPGRPEAVRRCSRTAWPPGSATPPSPFQGSEGTDERRAASSPSTRCGPRRPRPTSPRAATGRRRDRRPGRGRRRSYDKAAKEVGPASRRSSSASRRRCAGKGSPTTSR